MLTPHFRAWEMIDPRHLNEATFDTGLLNIVRVGQHPWGVSYKTHKHLHSLRCSAPSCADCIGALAFQHLYAAYMQTHEQAG